MNEIYIIIHKYMRYIYVYIYTHKYKYKGKCKLAR